MTTTPNLASLIKEWISIKITGNGGNLNIINNKVLRFTDKVMSENVTSSVVAIKEGFFGKLSNGDFGLA